MALNGSTRIRNVPGVPGGTTRLGKLTVTIEMDMITVIEPQTPIQHLANRDLDSPQGNGETSSLPVGSPQRLFQKSQAESLRG